MKRLISIVLLFASLTVQAQTAMQILDRTADRIRTSGGLTANFTATQYNGSVERESISGSAAIMGQKFVLKTPEMSSWYNGSKMWTLINGSNEVNLTKPSQNELQKSSPVAFINIYKKGYKLSVKSTKLRGENIWEVMMKVQKHSKQPSVIIADIDKSYNPLCIRLKSGKDWTRIVIKNMKKGKLTDNSFNFPSKDFPNYTIIDMQ